MQPSRLQRKLCAKFDTSFWAKTITAREEFLKNRMFNGKRQIDKIFILVDTKPLEPSYLRYNFLGFQLYYAVLNSLKKKIYISSVE